MGNMKFIVASACGRPIEQKKLNYTGADAGRLVALVAGCLKNFGEVDGFLFTGASFRQMDCFDTHMSARGYEKITGKAYENLTQKQQKRYTEVTVAYVKRGIAKREVYAAEKELRTPMRFLGLEVESGIHLRLLHVPLIVPTTSETWEKEQNNRRASMLDFEKECENKDGELACRTIALGDFNMVSLQDYENLPFVKLVAEPTCGESFCDNVLVSKALSGEVTVQLSDLELGICTDHKLMLVTVEG